VGLRIEEHLGMPDALRGGPPEVGVGEVGEVLGPLEDGGQLVVQVEEGLQVLEVVGRAQVADGRVRQRHAVARGQFERQLRLEGAFDVQVQYGFRKGHRSIVRPWQRGI
jgi:hypothetical protein